MLPIGTSRADLVQQEQAWTTTLAMLEANNVDAAAKLFAVTTLKGKVWVVYFSRRPY